MASGSLRNELTGDTIRLFRLLGQSPIGNRKSAIVRPHHIFIIPARLRGGKCYAVASPAARGQVERQRHPVGVLRRDKPGRLGTSVSVDVASGRR